ncbi:MAG: ribosome-associated translation inhibitor RaiA [Bryobacterales bacterium]|nr:ribosome-associated translation inhibitor RaiA [Bryobacterales bacterium]
MRIEYTGRKIDLTGRERGKIERKLAKIQRILTRRGDLKTHVRLSRQRHLCEAEVMLRILRHTLVVASTGSTTFAAVYGALDKLERQAVRNKHKLIDTRRPGTQRDRPSLIVSDSIRRAVPGELSAQRDTETARPARIVRSRSVESKPMTEDEAMLLLESGDRDYVSYRDAGSDKIHVLLRRRDGVAELIEGS